MGRAEARPYILFAFPPKSVGTKHGQECLSKLRASLC